MLQLYHIISGFLTTTGIESVGFFPSSHSSDNSSYPHIQILMKSALTGTIGSREKFNSFMKRINMESKVLQQPRSCSVCNVLKCLGADDDWCFTVTCAQGRLNGPSDLQR